MLSLVGHTLELIGGSLGHAFEFVRGLLLEIVGG